MHEKTWGAQTAEQRVFNYDSQIEPYVMMNPDYGNNATSAASGSRQQFIGYIPDLLQELSYIIQFDYDIQPVQDASFGHRRLDGTWDGMVGQLIDRVSRQFRCSALTTRYNLFTTSAKQEGYEALDFLRIIPSTGFIKKLWICMKFSGVRLGTGTITLCGWPRVNSSQLTNHHMCIIIIASDQSSLT